MIEDLAPNTLLKTQNRSSDGPGIESVDAVEVTDVAFLGRKTDEGNIRVKCEVHKSVIVHNHTINWIAEEKNFELLVKVGLILVENGFGQKSAKLFKKRHGSFFTLHVVLIGSLTVGAIELRNTLFKVRGGEGRLRLIKGVVTVFKIVNYEPHLFVTRTHRESNCLNNEGHFRKPLGTEGGAVVGGVEVFKHSNTHKAGIGLHVADTRRRMWAG